MVAVLATNGGPHPPDKWAAVAAEQIGALVQIEDNSNSDAAIAARKAKPRFALDVADALEASFAAIAAAERGNVKSGAVKKRNDPFSVDAQADAAVSAIVKIASKTPFAKHFSSADVQKTIRNILTQHFIDAANIERSWAFDAKGL